MFILSFFLFFFYLRLLLFTLSLLSVCLSSCKVFYFVIPGTSSWPYSLVSCRILVVRGPSLSGARSIWSDVSWGAWYQQHNWIKGGREPLWNRAVVTMVTTCHLAFTIGKGALDSSYWKGASSTTTLKERRTHIHITHAHSHHARTHIHITHVHSHHVHSHHARTHARTSRTHAHRNTQTCGSKDVSGLDLSFMCL